MSKFCRKCGNEKHNCICKKSNINYPLIITVGVSVLVFLIAAYFFVLIFI